MKLRPRILLPCLVVLAACAGPAFAYQDDLAARDAQYRAEVRPLVEKYCGSCHGPEEPKGSLDLLQFTSLSELLEDQETWDNVVVYVDSGSMPPAGQPMPSDEESSRLVAWVESTLTSALCEGPADPGKVTIRRLNRAEYDNTIRDLFGLDFHPAADFPTDDVGYGFDNIADVLTLSPLLLEKYMDAAEQVARRAILTARTAIRPVVQWEPAQITGDGDPYERTGRMLVTDGTIQLKHDFPAAGTYVMRIDASADQAGDEPARMRLSLGDGEVETFDVANSRGDHQRFEAMIEVDSAGERSLGVSFLNDFYDEKARRDRRDRNLVVMAMELEGPFELDQVALPESHREILFREPAEGADMAAIHEAARAVLDRFVSRAFRRPGRAEEIDRLLPLVDLGMAEGGTFADGVQLAVVAVLVSPEFLYRVELDPQALKPGPTRELTDYELASRLSYFLWSSMPDDELFELAAKGTLHEPATLKRQVMRMLADPKLATGLVANFAPQWLQVKSIGAFFADKQLFPEFGAELRDDMLTETTLFFDWIARENRSVLEFIDSDTAFLNERLARHYGIDGVQGNEFRPVQLPDESPRGGVITQASVLTVTSNPSRTSPVKRGKWILEAILGTPPPPPPPNVPALSEDRRARESASLRERLEQHRADPACAVCHDRMDTLGFGFENFNAIGAWRDKDGRFEIDSSGTLPTGESFQNPVQLKTILLEQRAGFVRALSEKMMTYALGRGLALEDRCVVDEIAQTVAQDDYHFASLVTSIVLCDPFRTTRTQAQED